MAQGDEVFYHEDIIQFSLNRDGTVTIQFKEGNIEQYGYWKGKWIVEAEHDGSTNQ